MSASEDQQAGRERARAPRRPDPWALPSPADPEGHEPASPHATRRRRLRSLPRSLTAMPCPRPAPRRWKAHRSRRLPRQHAVARHARSRCRERMRRAADGRRHHRRRPFARVCLACVHPRQAPGRARTVNVLASKARVAVHSGLGRRREAARSIGRHALATGRSVEALARRPRRGPPPGRCGAIRVRPRPEHRPRRDASVAWVAAAGPEHVSDERNRIGEELVGRRRRESPRSGGSDALDEWPGLARGLICR